MFTAWGARDQDVDRPPIVLRTDALGRFHTASAYADPIIPVHANAPGSNLIRRLGRINRVETGFPIAGMQIVADRFEMCEQPSLQFKDGDGAASLGLSGRETFDITGITEGLTPRGEATVRAVAPDGTTREFTATVRIDTPEELIYYRHGGILPYMLRQLVRDSDS